MLILFNWDSLIDIVDLDNAFYGYHSDIPPFSSHSTCRDYSTVPPSGKDMVKKEYREIDLYIWVDWDIDQCDGETGEMTKRHNQKWFCCTGPQGKNLWSTYFSKENSG